jgi:pimeloyl-ACP methyl ester carboxylesterase
MEFDHLALDGSVRSTGRGPERGMDTRLSHPEREGAGPDRASWSELDGPPARPRRPRPYNEPRRRGGRGWGLPVLLGSAALLGAAAYFNHRAAEAAERRHPPRGRFLHVDGVRLHYIERGQGEPVVLFHGNGALTDDMVTSGLVERLALNHRVIVFDRPGFGYSGRPRTRIWTPMAQAELLYRAIHRLGIGQATILGHSLGALVALSLVLRHPSMVRGLVLLSGYYYPSVRFDVPLFSGPAIPVIGDVMRYTVSPPAATALLPKIYAKLFAPAPIPERFEAEFPHDLVVRPSHLRAASADNNLMIPYAAKIHHLYPELRVPVTIVSGTDDQVVTFERQAQRLADEVPQAELVAVPGAGHMVHHFAPDLVARIVERMAGNLSVNPAADTQHGWVREPEPLGGSY